MWIERENGRLLNLDHIEDVGVEEGSIVKAFTPGIDPDITCYHLATFKTRKQVEAAMDRLKKWLWSDGWIAESGVGQKESRKVFSFRTLSEDDEFKE